MPFSDMDVTDEKYERFKALVGRHRKTIFRVATAFYAPRSYLFHELECDLITYLWQVCRDMTPDMVIVNEERWMHKVLYHHALNLTRHEARYQQHNVYGADLTELADIDRGDPLVSRLYILIALLPADDRKLVMQYIAKTPVRQMAKERGMSLLSVYRRISRICDELRRLNAVTEVDEEFVDSDRLFDYEKENKKEGRNENEENR